MTVNWPAVLKIENDAELLLLADQNAWDSEASNLPMLGHASDQIIDSQGKIFNLKRFNSNHISIADSGTSMNLIDFLGLVKAHAAAQGTCCVAKLYAPSYQDAFEMLASLAD